MIKLYSDEPLPDSLIDILDGSGIDWVVVEGNQRYDTLRVLQLIFAHNWGQKRADMDSIHDYVYEEDEELF